MLLQVLDSTLLLLQIPSLRRCCCNPTLMQIVYVWSGLERVFPKRQARQFVLAWLPSQTMFLLQAHAELAQVPKIGFTCTSKSLTNSCSTCSVDKNHAASAVKFHIKALDTRACSSYPHPQTAGLSEIDLAAANL